VKYVAFVYSFNHFSHEDDPALRKVRRDELGRVANKVAQQLGSEYFWIAASCTSFTEDEKATLSPEEMRRIEEQDVCREQCASNASAILTFGRFIVSATSSEGHHKLSSSSRTQLGRNARSWLALRLTQRHSNSAPAEKPKQLSRC
jgi:hypothetical protein